MYDFGVQRGSTTSEILQGQEEKPRVALAYLQQTILWLLV